jgi:hypothetical protein
MRDHEKKFGLTIERQAFFDNADAALGLGVQAIPAGVHLEHYVYGESVAFYPPLDLRALEHGVEAVDPDFVKPECTGPSHLAFEHQKSELLARAKAAGISDVREIIPSNDGAHDQLSRMLDDGYDLYEALDYLASDGQAVDPKPAPIEGCNCGKTPCAKEHFTERAVENLMKAAVAIVGGSSSKSKHGKSYGLPDPLTVQSALQRKMAS